MLVVVPTYIIRGRIGDKVEYGEGSDRKGVSRRICNVDTKIAGVDVSIK